MKEGRKEGARKGNKGRKEEHPPTMFIGVSAMALFVSPVKSSSSAASSLSAACIDRFLR